MKVTNIQNYNNPTFGALILKPNSGKYLSTLGQKALTHIDIVNQDLKNTTFYNLEIRDTLVINDLNGDRIYPPYRIDKAGKHLMIRGRWGLDNVSKRIVFENKAKMLQAYKDITESDTQILRTGKIVKYLDDYEKKISQNNIQKK